ncbi:DUF6265 family protein [Longitalea arenae]|uniref:DUF6265 family protein n=1 Tax=Longitalea arenae TaxID=2812558 RepID=UPI0019681151|nr:DUF6265 family protein [Longitalea arenae]
MGRTICFIGLLLTCMHVSFAQQAAWSGKEFKPLFGLSGLWKMDTPRGALYEAWDTMNDSLLSGRSFRVKGSDTMVLEQVTISFQDNAIFYTPVVHDQNDHQPVVFKLISYNNNRYVFENAAHVYPQRVIYELVSASILRARIEGSKNGREMGSDFVYSRVK